MTKIIQTRIAANGDVHVDFSGFVGGDCKIEEDRLRRELAALGLNVGVDSHQNRLAVKQSGSFQVKAS